MSQEKHHLHFGTKTLYVFTIELILFEPMSMKDNFDIYVRCNLLDKVELLLEQREVAFLSPSKICENLNFTTEIAG